MADQVGQFTVPAMSGVQTAAAQIADSTQTGSQSAGVVPSMRQATIVSSDGGTPPTVTVTFDGVTNVAGIRYAYPYIPQANDVVYCVILGGVTWVLCELTTAVATVNNRPPLGPIGLADNGYTTVPGFAYHTANTAAATGINEMDSDYRITVPGSTGRQIELKFSGFLQFTGSAQGGNAIVLGMYTYSGGLGAQRYQSNYSGVNGDWSQIAMRQRITGPASSTTYTMTISCAGGNLGSVVSSSSYPALFTIDDVGSNS